MGYYSEVGIKCEKNAFDMLIKAAKEVDFLPDEVCKNRHEEYTMLWYGVKWYEYCTEVAAIHRVLDELNELDDKNEDGGYGYNFIRIGEEIDDNEQFGNYGGDNLEFYINRSIDADGSFIDMHTL